MCVLIIGAALVLYWIACSKRGFNAKWELGRRGKTHIDNDLIYNSLPVIRGEPEPEPSLCGTGWLRIGRLDSRKRRSLWVRVTDKGVELCAGREGGDSYVCFPPDHPMFPQVYDLITTAIFAASS